jgi:hypothetical protein
MNENATIVEKSEATAEDKVSLRSPKIWGLAALSFFLGGWATKRQRGTPTKTVARAVNQNGNPKGIQKRV